MCIVGKSWDFHVTEALRTTLDEGVAMVGESVAFLAGAGRRVFFDAEHFFDGYKANPEYALRVVEAAATNGVACVVLCDTNGGSLPSRGAADHAEVVAYLAGVDVGIHTQNDSGCAVANSVAAVLGGATQVQGTVNGYGERTGNANLMTVIPDLTLKLGIQTLPPGPAGAAHAGEPARGRAGQPASPPVGPLRRDLRLRPQGRACTPRRWGGPGAPATSTSTPSRWATTPGCWCRTWAAGPAWP